MDETESSGGENGGNALLVVGDGGYNRQRRPSDDCCPICFDSFSLPCKTSCGHWFCSGCILQHWRYTTDIKQCKCPMCGSLIIKLVPLSSARIPQGEDAAKILNDINRYNRLTVGGWRTHFWILLNLFFQLGGFDFFPKGMGMQLLFDALVFAIILFFLVDICWYRWRLKRQVRRLAQEAGLQQPE